MSKHNALLASEVTVFTNVTYAGLLSRIYFTVLHCTVIMNHQPMKNTSLKSVTSIVKGVKSLM